MTYQNEWFHGRHSRRQLPLECVGDCSGAGDRAADVAAWVKRLRFDGPPWLFREYLKESGAWLSADLCDHNENRKRVLYLWANDCARNPSIYDYLYLGI